MTWLTKLRTYLGHDEQRQSPVDEESALEAAQALHSARSALGEARQRRDEVREVTTSLEKLRERNHYGESIYLAMLPREHRA